MAKRYLLIFMIFTMQLLLDSRMGAAYVIPVQSKWTCIRNQRIYSSLLASNRNEDVFKQDSNGGSNSSPENIDSDTRNKNEAQDDDIILGPLAAAAAAVTEQQEDDSNHRKAAIGTVNERLQAELKAATDKEKYGARSAMGEKMGLDSFRSTKTDAEREAAIQEARNLNGVNPAIAIGGSFFALGIAAGLWGLTNWLAEFFAMHPIDSTSYFVNRVTAVFRNVVIGLVSLASGFFGVTGVGIFALGLRVAYGVLAGELDPTPLKKNKKAEEELNMPNVWDLMMNKKPGRPRK